MPRQPTRVHRKNSFTTKLRQAADLAMTAVYVVSHPGGPTKVGIAKDVHKRFISLCHATWCELRLHAYGWTMGRPVAELIEADVILRLTEAGKRVRGEWFNIEPDEMHAVVRECAKARGFNLYTDADRDALQQAAENELRERLLGTG